MRSSRRLLVSQNPPLTLTPVEPRVAVTAEDLQAHAKKLLSNVNLRILVVGNMYKEVSKLCSSAVSHI